MAQLTTSIRPMDAEDIPAVALLEGRVFADPWSENAFREELAAAGRRYLVAEEGRALVGYGGLLVVEDDAHIVTLAVEEGVRGRGLGTRLMLRLAEEARRAGAAHLTLEVRVSNQPAQSLYRRFGFETVGVRRHYYRDEDALIMWALDIDSEGYQRRLAEIGEGLR
jgi:ribosomal-protein-alanine N-acetyltransferase